MVSRSYLISRSYFSSSVSLCPTPLLFISITVFLLTIINLLTCLSKNTFSRIVTPPFYLKQPNVVVTLKMLLQKDRGIGTESAFAHHVVSYTKDIQWKERKRLVVSLVMFLVLCKESFIFFSQQTLCNRVRHFNGVEMIGGEGGNVQPSSYSGHSDHAEYTSLALTTTITTTKSPPPLSPPLLLPSWYYLVGGFPVDIETGKAEEGRGGRNRNGYLGHRVGWVIYKRILLNVLEPMNI